MEQDPCSIDKDLAWKLDWSTTSSCIHSLCVVIRKDPRRTTRQRPRDLNRMFFLHERERTITLHPSFFGQHINEYLSTRLHEDVEGTCEGLFYNICVLDIINISEGRVLPSTALAEFIVRYRCVVWRPFKGETVCFPRTNFSVPSLTLFTRPMALSQV